MSGGMGLERKCANSSSRLLVMALTVLAETALPVRASTIDRRLRVLAPDRGSQTALMEDPRGMPSAGVVRNRHRQSTGCLTTTCSRRRVLLWSSVLGPLLPCLHVTGHDAKQRMRLWATHTFESIV